MRALNIFAAISGALAMGMLAAAAHPLRDALAPEDLERIKLAAFVQTSAACAGLALSNRKDRLSLIAGALILAGAALFAGALYAISLTQDRTFAVLAPVGGLALIGGWLVLAFSRPRL